MDFGRWEGRSWIDISASDADLHRHWRDNWVIQQAPEGESFADVIRRTGAWLAALLSSTAQDDCVLAVAHAGSIRALLCHALGARLAPAPCARTVRGAPHEHHAFRTGVNGACGRGRAPDFGIG